MIVKDIQGKLFEKSKRHQADLARLGKQVEDEALSPNVLLLSQTNQIKAMDTILRNPTTCDVDFLFYFDRLATLLVERCAPLHSHHPSGLADTSQGPRKPRLPPHNRHHAARPPLRGPRRRGRRVRRLRAARGLVLRARAAAGPAGLPARPPSHPDQLPHRRAGAALPAARPRHGAARRGAGARPADVERRRGAHGRQGARGSWCEPGPDCVCHVHGGQDGGESAVEGVPAAAGGGV